ncbi:CheY chemotaxis protein or a CheY-like REC (receiver) domain [Granulicella pectinivorans]|uniref:CheY chemotaxis protein or a CheY-like REC (Receiver) domain n=1 Tax=Granulicella pectinivorans TaxID=474950 RepID=A0A1I6LQQ2_9BACT|nr:response regulator [Granulicella pectinivorans]SFS05709.1 CheY chemotaxis protein or a CheY-like REC (receiver) domain [Granulicella pectinivorans]
MTSDQNSPDVQQSVQGGPPPVSSQDSLFTGTSNTHGMGQSKSSRRRRRKRKSKSEGGDSGEQAGGEQSVGSVQASAATESAPRQQQPFQANGGGQQQQNNGEGGSTKRWKKKFRDRKRTGSGGGGFENNPGNQSSGGGFSQNNQNGGGQGGFRSADTHQFGNNAGASSKRKGPYGGKQQRSGGGGGGRSFVGPMDHSYRAVNGNFADTPPSTIETHQNGNYQGRGHARPSFVSDSQPIDYSQGRAIPIAEDAPTKIIFFIEDLFFLAKISETARKLGVKVAFMKNDKDAIAALTASEEADRPGLIVFDLNNANAKPLTLIPKLKAKLKKSTSIIGFLSHLQGDLKAKAVEAGCDTVMPRSAFSQNLPNLLRRYGIVEEEEPNFNM